LNCGAIGQWAREIAGYYSQDEGMKGQSMTKLDLRKELKYLYLPSTKKVELVEVPPMKFVMISGEIEVGQSPGSSPAFQQAMEALYGVTYSLKFISKLRKENPIDYTVMALEALWWVEDGEFDIKRPDNWRWTAMMMQPNHIDNEMYRQAVEQVHKKRNSPALEHLSFETFYEGLSIQIMHIGPYANEPETLVKMDDFARQNGYSYRGKHHEIYRVPPGDPAKLDRSAPSSKN
jgi:hypothetical protein